MINMGNVVSQKQRQLAKIKVKSNKALDIVASTINKLTMVNEKIDATISEISDTKEQLQLTEDDLSRTKENNAKIINKFKALIED